MTQEMPQTNEETKEIPKQEFVGEKEISKPKEIEEDSNIVFIGNKPFMKYVTSAVIQFTTKNKDEVIIKARGKFINKAVDIAEFTRKRFLEDKNLKIKDIKINSEGFKNKEGKDVNVSTIEITLSQK